MFLYCWADVTSELHGPRILMVSIMTHSILRHHLASICDWNNVEVGPGKYSTVEYYKAALEVQRNYEMIIMHDKFTNGCGPDAVRELRQSLAFKGYIICIANSIRPEKVKTYTDQGANKVFRNVMSEEDVLEVQKGESRLPRNLL